MPIKPEDVTDQHIKQIKDYLESQIGWPLMPDNSQLATLANALIQAGIASPPVWVIRNQMTGELNGCYLVDDIQLVSDATRYLDDDCKYEHWKGQAE